MDAVLNFFPYHGEQCPGDREDHRGLVGAVVPAVPGAVLDDDIALGEVHLDAGHARDVPHRLTRFPLDAAILFSDILVIPDAMGLGLYFAEGEGPRFERTVRDERALASLVSIIGTLQWAGSEHPFKGESLSYMTDPAFSAARFGAVIEGYQEGADGA